MELPIRIMITLFVALIVAMVIIGFSNKMINDAKEKVKDIGGDELPEEDKIIEVTSVSNSQLASLAEDCFRKSQDMLASEICYVVLGSIDANEADIMDRLSILTEENVDIDLSSADNAVRIKYNAISDKIEITG
jgi:hypothetical protein